MMMVRCVYSTGECVPSEHTITITGVNGLIHQSSRAYCDGHGGGGDCTSFGGWTWVGSTCKYHAGQTSEKGCPCSGHYCGGQNSGSVYCRCGPEANKYTSDGCFTSTKYCGACPVAQYRKGCGCTSRIVEYYTDALTGFRVDSAEEATGTVEINRETRWSCSAGECVGCPAGYYCIGDFNFPIECPDDTFAVADSSECKTCKCSMGKYNPAYTAKCDKNVPFTDSCIVCDECTPLADIPAYASQRDLCPRFNSKKFRKTTTGDCVDCMQCDMEGKKYARPSNINNCIKDDITECIEQYYNVTLDNSLTDDSNGLAENRQADTSLVVIGAMPWRPGAQRIAPSRLYRNNPGNNEGGRPGLIPYYKKCDPKMYSGGGYRPRAASLELDALDWSNDCSAFLTRECASGYYAKLGGNSSGLRVLISCEMCPLHSVGEGGLSEVCGCESGFASMSALLQKFGGPENVYVPNVGDNVQACVNCSTSVMWRHSDSGLISSEALKCSSGGGIESTNHPLRYFSQETQDWATCAKVGGAQSIPAPDRLDCFKCEPGKYYSGDDYYGTTTAGVVSSYKCLPCRTQTFQDLEGQPACKPKKMSCDKGYVIKIDYNSYTSDNACETCPTECEEGQIMIMALNKSHDDGDTCDGKGNSFFGCYEGNGRGLGLNASARLAYRDGGNSVSVQFCNEKLLPPNAEWVSYSRPSGAECYFACQYGVNEAISAEFRLEIQNYVYTMRQDLKNFLIYPRDIPSSAAAFTASSVLVDTNWELNIAYTAEDLNGGSWNVPTRWAGGDSAASGAFLANTFLFIDEVMAAHKSQNSNISRGLLCLSKEEAYGSKQCLRGFTRPSDFWVSGNKIAMCALEARNSFYAIDNNNKNNDGLAEIRQRTYAVVSLMGSKRQICESETGSLSSFRVGCSVNCLDQTLDLALRALSRQIPDSIWYRRLSWIWYYLQRSSWHELGNPYYMPPDACGFRCENTISFRYNTADHGEERGYDSTKNVYTACIPFIAASTVCGLFDPPRYVSAYSTPSGNAELTVREICSSCSQTKPDAILISSAQGSDNWWTSRYAIVGSNRDTSSAWKNIQCRYTCNVGYTSEMSSPSAYEKAPCVLCDSALPFSCKNATVTPLYRPATAEACGIQNNYVPYSSNCFSCAKDETTKPGMYIYYNRKDGSIPSSQGNCLAMCNPRIYHSFQISRDSTRKFVDYPVPRGELECDACSVRPELPCGSTCGDDFYLYGGDNSSSSGGAICLPCNVSSCPQPNYYREKCWAGFARDAQCVPCDDRVLFNSAAVGERLLNAAAQIIFESNETITRKWVSGGLASVLHPFPQCEVACINNYAWLNTSTGLSPTTFSTLTRELSCVPCDSAYVRAGLVGSSQKLYSIWNKANITPEVPSTVWGSALHSMVSRQVVGGCYLCPGFGNREVVDSSTEMCELKPGMTSISQGSGSSTLIYASSQLNPITTSGYYYSSLPTFVDVGRRRRHLLAVDNNNNNNNNRVMVVKVLRQPIVLGTGYFYCCSQLPSTSQIQDCKDQYMAKLEAKKGLQGEKWGSDNDFCGAILAANTNASASSANNNNNNRRLLTLDEASSSDYCYSGTFKEKRGDGPCLTCPAGASTTFPYSGIDSRHKCACLPGYSAERNISTGALLYCRECGTNYYRPPNSYNDSVCFECGPNAYTLTTTSSYCYCEPGMYLTSENGTSCKACRPGFYCLHNIETRCPENSISPPSSAKREDCTCISPQYYGSLSLPNSQCIRSPPGLKCASSNGCVCGGGWGSMVEVTFSQGGDVYMSVKCKSPCKAGEYAVLVSGDIEECKKCPVDSYSLLEEETMEFPGKPHSEQCARCPPNSHTSGEEGSTSPAACLCRGSSCGVCKDDGSYIDGDGNCQPCPAGTTSSTKGGGIESCACGPGHRITTTTTTITITNSTTATEKAIACEPCPLGYFSRSVGMSCTPCGKGMTTANVGSTSLRDCLKT